MRYDFDEELGDRLAAEWAPTDEELDAAVRSVPTHYSTAYVNAQSSTGTCVLTQPAAPGVAWNLTACSISFAGPTLGPNGKVTIYDGTAATGTIIHAEFLPGPGTGSVGTTVKLSIPVEAHGFPGLQASPGNPMTIVVSGTGANQVSVNARFTDGLP